jgi:hypothetical protein
MDMHEADRRPRPLGRATGWAHPRPPRFILAPPPERATQRELIRQARAARAAPAGPRPLAENLGTGLRKFYADVLALPLPAELARLIAALRERARGGSEPPQGLAG